MATKLTGAQIAQLAYQAGFRGEDLVQVVAIAKRESSYNPQAFNGNSGTGDKSYGLMQINMIGDMGPARMKSFGISSPEQLFDPLTNMKAAYALYKSSGNKLTPWGGYKGVSDTHGANVEAARAVVNDAGTQGLLGKDFVASTGVAAGDQAVSNLSDADIGTAAAQYGYAASFLNDPSLGPVLRDAIRLGWTPARLQAEIQKTDWYRNYSSSVRAFEVLAANDPSTAKSEIAQRQADLSDQATKLGLNLNPDRLKTMAWNSLAFGWSPTQVTDALTHELSYSPDQASQGQVGAQTQQVKQLAAKYYLNISDQSAFDYAKQIVSGQLDINGVDATFQGQAKGKFPTLAKYIDAGISPDQFFSPYKAEAAKLLDVPEASIDLMNDPRYSKVLSTAGSDGMLRPMSISEFQTMIRNTPQWDATKGAKDSAASFGEMLTRTFGGTK